MARNDFMTGFLMGLYQSGVGNPEVQRQNEAAQQDSNAKLTAAMADKGQMPNTLPSDHPVREKIGGFISSLMGGPSTAPLTAASFTPNPNFAQYYQDPNGKVGFSVGQGMKTPPGTVAIPVTQGVAQMGQQRKVLEGNVPFETARSMATLMKKPNALDGVISAAQAQGRDYLTKDEMANSFKAVTTGSMADRGDYFKGMLKVHQDRLTLSQRQAAFGKAGYGANQISLNTALQHASSVQDGLDAINNTDIALLNVPINKLKENTNDPAIVALEAEVTALSDELSTAFKGSSGTDIQMQEWAKFLKTSITPDQAAALMPTISDLLDARLTNLERQQKLVAPSVVTEGTIKSPSAEAAQKKLNSKRTTTGHPEVGQMFNGSKITKVEPLP